MFVSDLSHPSGRVPAVCWNSTYWDFRRLLRCTYLSDGLQRESLRPALLLSIPSLCFRARLKGGVAQKAHAAQCMQRARQPHPHFYLKWDRLSSPNLMRLRHNYIIREPISRTRMCIKLSECLKVRKMHLDSEPGDLWSACSSQEDCKLKKVIYLFSGRVSDVWEGFSDWNINTDKWKSNFTCICHIGWAIVRVLSDCARQKEMEGASET